MRRPPVVYRAPELRCGKCGKPVRPPKANEYGSWEHVVRLGIKDPEWHIAAHVA